MNSIPANDPQARSNWPMLAFFIALMLVAGALGSVATIPEIPGWYAGIAKPSWTPPDSVFGPVWTTLYVLTGIATWLAWRRRGIERGWVAPFVAQWVLNVAW